MAGVFALAAVFLWLNRGDIRPAWNDVLGARPGWIVLAIALTFAFMVNLGALHYAAQRATAAGPHLGRILLTAAGAHALNQLTKSGGMSGLALFRSDARRHGRPVGAVTAAYLLVTVLSEVGFAVALVSALVVVWIDGRITGSELAATAGFALLIGLHIGLLVLGTRDRDRMRRISALPARAWARMTRRAPRTNTSSIDELYDALHLLRRQRGAIIPAVALALAGEAIGIALLWSCLRAVGVHAGVSTPFVGYAVSVLFAIVGFLPGGLGFVEVSLGAVLVSFGLRGSTAAAVVVLYRVFELWLPLVIGGAAAHVVRRERTVTT
ncbi:MAG TPA: lysylphosphatidylglycerol synthase transmembrane domain-containing protein [Acidimicrobiales bacterium]|jgi:uncharacterized protein (TIRG00374 family)|nr:lysylphosphatidylglycerol synthase transmembrane domain-containing protein [Acidimicrobiales bacterium]